MKTKRLTKFGAVLSAALVLFSGILSVSAASVPQAVIDTGRKASVSLYIKQQKVPALTATAGKGWTMRLFVNSEFFIGKIRICTSDIPPFG